MNNFQNLFLNSFIKKIDTEEKTVYKIFGIKFSFKKKEVKQNIEPQILKSNDLEIYSTDNILCNLFKTAQTQNFIQDKKLTNIKAQNAVILPPKENSGGVVDENGEYIKISGWYRFSENEKSRGAIFGAYNTEEIINSNQKVIYLGVFFKRWGHFLTEGTARLYYPILNGLKDYKLAFVRLNSKFNLDKNYKEFIKLCGFKENDIIFVDKPTRFKEIIVPEASTIFALYMTKESKIPFDKIIQNTKSSNIEKVYFSRKKFKLHPTKGEDKIEKLFKQNGFKIFYPEKLSLSKTVSILKSAKAVAGLQGTALHNVLFTKDKINCIALMRSKANSKVGYFQIQLMINKLKNIKSTFIDASYDFLPINEGPYLVGITDCILKFAKENGFNLKNIKAQVKYKDVVWFFKNWLKIYPHKRDFDLWRPVQSGYDISKYLKSVMENTK